MPQCRECCIAMSCKQVSIAIQMLSIMHSLSIYSQASLIIKLQDRGLQELKCCRERETGGYTKLGINTLPWSAKDFFLNNSLSFRILIALNDCFFLFTLHLGLLCCSLSWLYVHCKHPSQCRWIGYVVSLLVLFTNLYIHAYFVKKYERHEESKENGRIKSGSSLQK